MPVQRLNGFYLGIAQLQGDMNSADNLCNVIGIFDGGRGPVFIPFPIPPTALWRKPLRNLELRILPK